MRRIGAIAMLVGLASCAKPVQVPTIQELKADPKLLAAWDQKCQTGEYSHLPADQHDNMCFTTREAGRSLAMQKASQTDSDFFNRMSKRK